jgi:hypothetical protein
MSERTGSILQLSDPPDFYIGSDPPTDSYTESAKEF